VIALLYRKLLFNPNAEIERDGLVVENLQTLRFSVIKFLKSFAEEGVNDIMK
jgi:hypothetical protein